MAALMNTTAALYGTIVLGVYYIITLLIAVIILCPKMNKMNSKFPWINLGINLVMMALLVLSFYVSSIFLYVFIIADVFKICVACTSAEVKSAKNPSSA